MSIVRSISKSLFTLGIGSALVALLLIAVSMFSTPEWTCEEVGGNWKCVGPTCNVDADKHFDASRRTVTCTRTDWAVATIGKAFDFLLPTDRELPRKPGA